MKTINWETMIKWKWANRDGRVISVIKRPSDGKEFTRVYCNCIAYIRGWYKEGRFPHLKEPWIYFTINGRKYRTSINDTPVKKYKPHKN